MRWVARKNYASIWGNSAGSSKKYVSNDLNHLTDPLWKNFGSRQTAGRE
jgi:hypothetical protein